MFTGLVQDLGCVDAVERSGGGVRLTVSTPLSQDLRHGDSIAVNGVCLTAVVRAGEPTRFAADVMHETLRRSSLATVTTGQTVNLELAARADSRLGGHIVQGHVDGLGAITQITPDGFARVLTVEVEGGAGGLLRYVVEKGSITVDGVSLTVARVDEKSFDVSLIPETLKLTTLGQAACGTWVNLEVDLMAKYAEKLLAPHIAALAQPGSASA